MRTRFLLCAFMAALAMAPNALANCGAAFCAVTTNWNIQGVPPTAGNGRIDLRYEFIDQSRPWNGSRRSDTAGDEEVQERKTFNRNVLATFDYTLTDKWAITASLPVVSRSHSHIAEPEVDPRVESRSFTRFGDARLLLSWRNVDAIATTQSYGLLVGVKLPTGPYKLGNDDGDRAERSLQPGTGSTDGIVGAFITQPGRNGALWFGQATLQSAAAIKDDYRPGYQFALTAGYRWPLTLHLTGVIQLNASVRGRDSGANAENTVTGNRFVFASPGLSWALSPLTDIYGFVQVPLYRNTNGAQLTFDWAAVAGITRRF